MPGYALSTIFRAKMRDAMVRAGVGSAVDPRVWKKSWTVHVQPIGRGAHAAHYLSRYVYHVALTNHRLERFADARVTFRYTHARTHATRRVTLPVNTFLARFLQHVLPRGLTKIRYDGLLSPTGRLALERARSVLERHAAPHARPAAPASAPASRGVTPRDSGTATIAASGVDVDTARGAVALGVARPAPRSCPVCARGALRLVQRDRRSRAPPW